MQGISRDTIVDERYRVLKRIGSGGMADVYCAEDLQLGRRVALKLLYRRFAEDDEFVERFRREASAAAGLQHPHVVAVFDRGEWDDTYYIAMEYLEGRSLKEVVREDGPLAPARAIDVAVQILKAARFAHRRGVVHRDMKPHNAIMDDEGRVKVTDFGIARAGASDMTETGSIMGTAQYLSPEQAQGHPVDARSDLYSIGIVLYELLTGRVPFEGDAAVTVALKQVAEAPAPPSHLNPAVPPDLEAVVLRALAKDPAQRFQDADAFIAALEGVRGGAPAGATRLAPPSAVHPVGVVPIAPDDLERRRRTWPWWLAGLLVAAALGVAAFLALRTETDPVPRVVGRTADTAARTLREAGFEVDIQTAESATVRRDRVAAQDPAPLEEAEAGSTVVIVVSAGPGEAAVPDVTGEGRRTAARRLRDAGFRVDAERRASDEVEEDRVIETRPPARSTLERGRTVVLVVSSGPRAVEVPDVTALSREEAQSALEQRGLAVTVREEETEEEEPGQVLRQDPAAGARLERGATVTLTVAQAPSEVEVPDLVGRQDDAASRILTRRGFEVATEEEAVDLPEDDDVVLDQDPAPGERAERGSTVTLTVGQFDPGENLDPDAGESPAPEPTAAP